jgi:hypothetical protein
MLFSLFLALKKYVGAHKSNTDGNIGISQNGWMKEYDN